MVNSIDVKGAVLKAMRAGSLTFDEIVKLSNVSRFTLYRWAKEAGIDCRARRAKRATAVWERATKGPRARPSKGRLHQIADEAKVAWDQQHEFEPTHPEA